MQHGLSIPPFGHLSDPRDLAALAQRAEESGWHGFYIWDHILRPPADPREAADTWVALAAIAASTSSIRIGPMVTPITRRRPIKLAREATSVDQLSNGRLTLGLGLGVDSGGELSRFGEITDARTRADRLDEGVELLTRFWSGEEVTHHGEHFTADGVTIRPTPIQEPRIPLWFAARGAAPRPTRRAARYDGLFAIEIDLDGLQATTDIVRTERGSLDGFDIAVHAGMVDDVTDPAQVAEMESRGVTWLIHSIGTHSTIADVENLIASIA